MRFHWRFLHFRDIRNITKLTSQPEIVVFDDEFADQVTYLNAIIKLISENCKKQRCIVFLDPDTGLEPNGKPNHKHVRENELEAIWKVMPPQWVLVFYQHKTTRRNGEEWVELKRKQFADATVFRLTMLKSLLDLKLQTMWFFSS